MSDKNGDLLRHLDNLDVLPYEITRYYPGQHIIFSEDEKRVIGASKSLDEAFDQAEASGVKGLWHCGYGYDPNVTYVF